MIKLTGNAGFSIPELIMASVVMVLIFLGTISIYVMLQTLWTEDIAKMNLQSDARTAMDRMARGAYGHNGLEEASGRVVSANSTTITFTSGIDSKERSFYLDGGKVFHDPDTSAGGDEFFIAENVSDLTFSAASDIVTIKLNMQKNVSGKTVSVNLSTKVRLRNMSL